MKTRRIPKITKWWQVLVLISMLLLWIGFPAESSLLDKQLVQPKACGNIAQGKISPVWSQHVEFEDQQSNNGLYKTIGPALQAGGDTRTDGIEPFRVAEALSRGGLTPYLAATTQGEQPAPTTVPSGQSGATSKGSELCLPYREKKRISIPETFGAGRQCYAVAYEEIVSREPLLFLSMPAWLCFSCDECRKGRTCFEARSEAFAHQFVHRLEIVPIFRHREPREAILFSARFYGGGSGWSKLITLWVYRKECALFANVLPAILISTQDEFKILSVKKDSREGVLVVAQAQPTEGESRFDPQKYRIRIYQYRDEWKKFQELAGSGFLTRRRYGFESKGATEVINDHIEKVKQVLDQRCGKGGSP